MPLFALLMILLAAAPAGKPVLSRPAASPAPATLSPDAIFSRRALRRARLIIQMRLLQLRDERLECAREAITRRLPPDLRPDIPVTVVCRE